MIAVLRACAVTLSWRHMECIEKDIHNLWSLYLTWCIVCCSQRFLSFIEAGTPSFAKNYVTKINVHVLAYVNALGELYIDVSETFFWKTLWKSDVFLVSWMTIFSYINKKKEKSIRIFKEMLSGLFILYPWVWGRMREKIYNTYCFMFRFYWNIYLPPNVSL